MDGAKKQVKWVNETDSIPEETPIPHSDESDVKDPVEGLDYVNFQLVTHGFCKNPGLDLDGLSNASSERTVKCIMGMLSQRMDDMSRSEELATKLRTLTYDFQRVTSMHQTAQEVAARAEREMNLYKTKMQAAARAQHAAESTHKQTTAELQRARNLMQGIRATHQSELRKKEKEFERITEKWCKLADSQVKLMATPSGIRCANVSVVTGQENLGQGQGFLEIALEEAEKSRNQLIDENIYLRKLVLTAANELVTASHRIKSLSTSTNTEPSYLTLTSLFPIQPHDFVETKVSSLASEFRAGLFKYLESGAENPSGLKSAVTPHSSVETPNLQKAIQSLNKELDQLKETNASQAAELRVLRHENADERQKSEESRTQSSALLEAERIQLERGKKQLEHQNQELIEMREGLEREKARIERERIKLQDERRAWQVEQMLVKPSPDPTPEKEAIAAPSPERSPRRPSKGGVKNQRKSKSSSKKSNGQVIPPFETEVIPGPAHKLKSRPSVPLLATSFMLPPPTPHTSLPSQPALLQTLPPIDFLEGESAPGSTTPASPSPEPEEEPNPLGPPGTPEPARHSFPVAKPLAQRMIHAYSPAKPSPLSRILMLGNSPNSPEALQALSREVSLGNISEEEAALALGTLTMPAQGHAALEEAELGIEENPWQERKIEANLFAKSSAAQPRSRANAVPEKENTVRPRVFTVKPASPARPTAASKARSKAGGNSAAPRFKVAPPTVLSPRKGPRRVLRDSEGAAMNPRKYGT